MKYSNIVNVLMEEVNFIVQLQNNEIIMSNC